MVDQHAPDFWAESKDDEKRNLMLFAGRFEFLPDQPDAGDGQ